MSGMALNMGCLTSLLMIRGILSSKLKYLQNSNNQHQVKVLKILNPMQFEWTKMESICKSYSQSKVGQTEYGGHQKGEKNNHLQSAQQWISKQRAHRELFDGVYFVKKGART